MLATRQPPAGARFSPPAKFDFAWVATSPGSPLAGPAISSSTASAKATSAGIAIVSGYTIVSTTGIPSLFTTTWTEVGCVLLDSSNNVTTLSVRAEGQAVIFQVGSGRINLVKWGVADININGTVPTGVVNYVIRGVAGVYHIWLNGKLFGTATDTSTPGASAGTLPAIGAQAGSGGSGGGGALVATTGVLFVARTGATFSDAFCQKLSANPWQLFSTSARRLFAPPTTGATYSIIAEVGDYILTGVAATLQVARKLLSATGAFSLVGNDAALQISRKVTAATGSFTMTGVAAALQVARNITAGTGAYALTGNDATLVYTPTGVTYTLVAGTGSFALTGVAAGVTAQRKVSAATGSFLLTGVSAELQAARKLAADVGACVLTGVAATLKVSRKLSVDTGVYTYTGLAANIIYASSFYKATVLLSGVISKIPQAQVGTGLKPIVWVSNRFRQRQASEGTPLIFDPITKRWRLLQAGETLEV